MLKKIFNTERAAQSTNQIRINECINKMFAAAYKLYQPNTLESERKEFAYQVNEYIKLTNNADTPVAYIAKESQTLIDVVLKSRNAPYMLDILAQTPGFDPYDSSSGKKNSLFAIIIQKKDFASAAILLKRQPMKNQEDAKKAIKSLAKIFNGEMQVTNTQALQLIKLISEKYSYLAKIYIPSYARKLTFDIDENKDLLSRGEIKRYILKSAFSSETLNKIWTDIIENSSYNEWKELLAEMKQSQIQEISFDIITTLLSYDHIDKFSALLSAGYENRDTFNFLSSIECMKSSESINYLKLKLLIQYGANIQNIVIHEKSILYRFIIFQRIDLIDLYLEHYNTINVKDTKGTTPLIVAVQTGNHDIIRKFLSARQLNIADKDGLTALFHAAIKDDLKTFMLLLESGSEINTALPLYYFLVKHKSINILNYVLTECLVKNIDELYMGFSAIQYAAMQNSDISYASLKKLAQAGANLQQLDSNQCNLLHLVCQSCQDIDKIKFLVTAGLSIEQKSATGDTPLHYVAQSNFIEGVNFLLDCGAKYNAVNNQSEYPIELLDADENIELTEQLLCRHGQECKDMRLNVRPVTLWLLQHNKLELFQQFLAKNVFNLEEIVDVNLTLLEWCIVNKKFDVAIILISREVNLNRLNQAMREELVRGLVQNNQCEFAIDTIKKDPRILIRYLPDVTALFQLINWLIVKEQTKYIADFAKFAYKKSPEKIDATPYFSDALQEKNLQLIEQLVKNKFFIDFDNSYLMQRISTTLISNNRHNEKIKEIIACARFEIKMKKSAGSPYEGTLFKAVTNEIKDFPIQQTDCTVECQFN